MSVAAGALAAGGAVEGFVAEDCRAAAVPAKMRVAANTHIAMLGNFRMDLVSQRFGAGANGGNCEVCLVMPRLPCARRGPGERPLRECEGAQARSLALGSKVWRARLRAKKSEKPPTRNTFSVVVRKLVDDKFKRKLSDKADCQNVPLPTWGGSRARGNRRYRFINKVSVWQKLVPILRPRGAASKDESRCGAIHTAHSRPETLLARHGLSGLGAEFCASVAEFAGFSATTA